VSLVGLASLGGAVFEALGPFTARVPGESLGCGSPFLGRWIGSAGDPAARLAFECLRAAPGRRTFAFVLGGVALCCLVAAAVVIVRAGRGSPDPSSRASRRLALTVSGLGATAAAVLLVGAAWAVLRVPTLPGGVGNPPHPTTPPPLPPRTTPTAPSTTAAPPG
jgi:hypothetical protein